MGLIAVVYILLLSILGLGQGTRQTDGRTDRQTDAHHFVIPRPTEVGGLITELNWTFTDIRVAVIAE